MKLGYVGWKQECNSLFLPLCVVGWDPSCRIAYNYFNGTLLTLNLQVRVAIEWICIIVHCRTWGQNFNWCRKCSNLLPFLKFKKEKFESPVPLCSRHASLHQSCLTNKKKNHDIRVSTLEWLFLPRGWENFVVWLNSVLPFPFCCLINSSSNVILELNIYVIIYSQKNTYVI